MHCSELRSELVAIALRWQERFGVAPAITSAISELDAAILVCMPEDEYCSACGNRTAVTRGCDFEFKGIKYQIKANRPSGKPGSTVRIVAKPNNYEWDKLIWMHYDRGYTLQEAWEWNVDEYRKAFSNLVRVRPNDMRKGRQLFPAVK